MRITGGELRSRKLSVPKGRTTRPTPDRVRESLFSILGEQVVGAAVLELFGGTGSLGIESLSRGADSVVFFERDRAALGCLRSNLETLGIADRATIFVASAFDAPSVLAGRPPFDLVFCDPPFRFFTEPDRRRRLADLFPSLPLAEGAVLVVEHRTGTLCDFAPPGLDRTRVQRYGTTSLALYRKL